MGCQWKHKTPDASIKFRSDIEAYGHVTAYNGNVVLAWQGVASVAWGNHAITGGYDQTIRIWKDWNQQYHTQVRLDLLSWNMKSKCLPVPDEYFAMDNEWKLYSCGYPKDKCIHRTFHHISIHTAHRQGSEIHVYTGCQEDPTTKSSDLQTASV